MRYTIQKGDKFKCIKTFIMDDGEKAYTKGKDYFSEVKSCITDNALCVYHNMDNVKGFFNYFKLVEDEKTN